jgi:hypothetical protein
MSKLGLLTVFITLCLIAGALSSSVPCTDHITRDCDESLNTLGSNRCTVNDDCYAERVCSSFGYCTFAKDMPESYSTISSEPATSPPSDAPAGEPSFDPSQYIPMPMPDPSVNVPTPAPMPEPSVNGPTTEPMPIPSPAPEAIYANGSYGYATSTEPSTFNMTWSANETSESEGNGSNWHHKGGKHHGDKGERSGRKCHKGDKKGEHGDQSEMNGGGYREYDDDDRADDNDNDWQNWDQFDQNEGKHGGRHGKKMMKMFMHSAIAGAIALGVIGGIISLVMICQIRKKRRLQRIAAMPRRDQLEIMVQAVPVQQAVMYPINANHLAAGHQSRTCYSQYYAFPQAQ